jgi:hypothetical protein
LQCAPQWPRPIQAIGAGFVHDPSLGLVRQPDFEAVARHGAINLVDL